MLRTAPIFYLLVQPPQGLTLSHSSAIVVEWWRMLLVTSFLRKCPDLSTFLVPRLLQLYFVSISLLEGNTVAAVFLFMTQSHLQVLLPGVVLNVPLSPSWTVLFGFYLRYSLHPSLAEEQPREHEGREIPWNMALAKCVLTTPPSITNIYPWKKCARGA